MSGPDEGTSAADPVHFSDLPVEVQAKAVAWTSEALASLKVDEVPSRLRRIRNFEPRRRVTLGRPQLVAALETGGDFRERVATWLTEARPELVALLEPSASEGSGVPAAPVAAANPAVSASPLDLAAAAFILDSPRAADLVAAAATASPAEPEGSAAAGGSLADLTRRVRELTDREQRDAARHRTEVERLRTARTELERDRNRQASEAAKWRATARRAEADRERSERDAADSASQLSAELAASRDQVARLRRRVAELERARRADRRASEETQEEVDTRRWLLVEAAFDAIAGLRRELGLTTPEEMPADAVAAALSRTTGLRHRWLSSYDVDTLAELVRLPRAHLVVDGYNLTKSSYPDLTLEAQRGRLVSGLAALVARTGVEATCVFDSTIAPVVAPVYPRTVRVVFSTEGRIADDVIRDLVDREPGGRTVIVVSSDREVADHARARGCHAVPSDVLAALLGGA